MKASFLVLEVVVLGMFSLMGVSLVIVGMLFVLDGPIYRSIYTTYQPVDDVSVVIMSAWR